MGTGDGIVEMFALLALVTEVEDRAILRQAIAKLQMVNSRLREIKAMTRKTEKQTRRLKERMCTIIKI